MTTGRLSPVPAKGARRRCSGGLTLIELLVALAIVAVLGVLSFRAVAAATAGRDRLADEFGRWRDITRLMQMLETDLLQIAARPPVAGAGAALAVTTGAGGKGIEFNFLRQDGANDRPRRVGYRLDDGHIVLERWPDGDATAAPAEDIVLDDVAGLRLAFITADGQRVAAWPPGPAAAPSLPAAIDLQLELPDAGTLQRLIALR
jgi:general secretion pathway protein J